MAEDLNKLIRQLNEAGYPIGFNKAGKPVIKNYPALKASRPDLYRRVQANNAALKAKLSFDYAPKLAKHREASARQTANWLERANQKVNEGVDAFMKSDIMKQDPAGIALALKLGRAAFLPESVTGKAVGLATMPLGGEEAGMSALERAGAATLPPVAGGVAGYASGEGTGQGIEQGALATGLSELGKIPAGMGKLSRWIRKPSLVEHAWDREGVGKVLGVLLGGLPQTSKRLEEPGSNWVKLLRGLPDNTAGKEAGQRFEEGMDSVVATAQDRAREMIEEAREAFRDKWQTEWSRPIAKGQQGSVRAMSKEMIDDARRLKSQIRDIWNGPKQIRNGIKAQRRLAKAAFDKMGRVKGTPSAQDAAEAYSKASQAIRLTLDRFDKGGIGPALRDTYDAIKQEYSQFAALRDLADNPEALSPFKNKINAGGIQKELNDNPRRYQSRLGDAWETVRRAVTRHAKEAEGIDEPGTLGKMRLIGHPGGMHALVDVLKTPYKTRLVGEAPGLLPKQSPIHAPVGTRVAGLLGNKVIDKMFNATSRPLESPAAAPSEE